MSNIPINKKLYTKVKSEAKTKFKVWPSAYASGWLVKEYKRRGGTYKRSRSRRRSRRSPGKSPGRSRRSPGRSRRSPGRSRRSPGRSRRSRRSPGKSRRRFRKKTSKSGLSRWFAEKWIDVCKLPKIVTCGRKSASNSIGKYPYCRPMYKINSKSPVTVKSLSRSEIRKRCSSKRKHPYKRVYSTIKRS